MPSDVEGKIGFEAVLFLFIVLTLFSNNLFIPISSLIFIMSSFPVVSAVENCSLIKCAEENLLLDIVLSISEFRNMRSEELTLLHLFLNSKSDTTILCLCLCRIF
ncbi:hypothetical protein PRUPE_7G224400 [Prunus persica]|uniref:Uncharacterized protein n=1 Tax=Prunus persica TaxID=3760 RepID=A0A251NFD6_PRUPE|nr:hypothetical protein PRUPE_7G224400 [Prunus persica]